MCGVTWFLRNHILRNLLYIWAILHIFVVIIRRVSCEESHPKDGADMIRRITLTLLTALALSPLSPVIAGHLPPPPPPPPPPDNPSSQRPDYEVPVGSPEYEFLVMHRQAHEKLAPTGYEISGPEDDTGAGLPWHVLPTGIEWKDFIFPMTTEKWSVKTRQIVEEYYKSPTKEELEALEKEGLSGLRVVEATIVPDNVAKAMDARVDMMRLYEDVHVQPFWIRQLGSRVASYRIKALDTLKKETKSRPPIFPFVEEYFAEDSNTLRGYAETTAYLEHVMGAKEFSRLGKDLKKLQRVRGSSLLVKLKEKQLHPWAKALRLTALERMTLEDIRKKGVKVYEKEQQKLQELYAAVAEIDPILDLYVLFSKLEAGEEVDPKFLRQQVEQGDWGLRLLVSRKLETTHPDNLDAVLPILLDLMRDKVREVRVAANTTLSRLFLMGPVMTVAPDVGRDSLVVREWQKWAAQREALKGPYDDKPIVIDLKLTQRNIYSPYGPMTHKVLEGKWGKLLITIVDHDDNGRFVDYGKDNFVVGDVLKPGQFLSRLVEVEGTWYHAELDEIYNRLELLPYRGPLGRLTIDPHYKKPFVLPFIILAQGADTTVTLFRDNGGYENHLVPVGSYMIYSSVIWDDRGPTTRVNQVHIGPGERRPIVVNKDEDTTLKIGGNIELRAEATYFTKIGAKPKTPRWLRVENPTLYGEAGENYRDPAYQYLMAYTGHMRTQVRAFGAPDDQKSFGTWDWPMTGTKMYVYEWYPFFKKFVKRDTLTLELTTDPGFAQSFTPMKFEVKLEEVDDNRYDKLMEKPTGDAPDPPPEPPGRGGGMPPPR